jgi:Protein of unknown function (DUF5818)
MNDPMPRGTHHIIDGLLLSGAIYPVVRVDGGGEWRLDMASKFYKLIGRRVRVEGIVDAIF